MPCRECKKLRLECERTAFDYQELVRLREADAPGSMLDGPEIWDFIMDMAVKKLDDAERTLADHQARHPSIIIAPVSILTMLSHTVTWEPGEFWQALSASLAF